MQASFIGETVSATSDKTVLITLGAFTLLGTMFTGAMTYFASRHARDAKTQATEANQAVNTVPKTQPRLYSLVEDLHRLSDERHREMRADVAEMRDNVREIRGRVDALEQPGWDGKTERRKTARTFTEMDRRMYLEERE